MKKFVIIAVAVLLINSAFGQQKTDTTHSNPKNAQPDSTVQLTMSLNDFRAVLREIDQNVDSKTVTNRLLQFLQKSARLLNNEPDKLKQTAKPNKEQPK
jgi:hypothetical protein